jgi:hypothetical protein
MSLLADLLKKSEIQNVLNSAQSTMTLVVALHISIWTIWTALVGYETVPRIQFGYRAYGAEQIGSSGYGQLFNRIGEPGHCGMPR